MNLKLYLTWIQKNIDLDQEDEMHAIEIPDRSWPFRLCPEHGPEQFNWRTFKWGPIRTHNNNDYRQVNWSPALRERRFDYEHRIVWKLYFGEIPLGMEVDHRDMNRGNNSIENLRLLTHTQNMKTCRPRKGSKLLPHRKALLLALPSSADFDYLARRWDCTKQHLLNTRSLTKKMR